jgi:hypothetical protein
MEEFVKYFLEFKKDINLGHHENFDDVNNKYRFGYTTGKGELPLLTPVYFRPFKEKHIKIKSYFPGRVEHVCKYDTIMSSLDTIIEADDDGFINTHKHKILKYFDPEKLHKIGEFVKQNRSISFEMENFEAAEELLKSLKYFNNYYKLSMHYGNYYNNYSVSKIKKDTLKFFILFLDLKYAVPLYSKKKVDGMGVCVGAYWLEYSKKIEYMYNCSQIYFVLSNYNDNVVSVDGGKINPIHTLRNRHIEDLYTALKEFGKDNKKAAKK